MFKYSIYAPNAEEWEKSCAREMRVNEPPSCEIYEDAFILPVKPEGPGNINVQTGFKGGVCDKSGKFVSGLVREYDKIQGNPKPIAFSVTDGYPFNPDEAETLDGEYIYCGIAIPWFGHLISDSMVYMWYAVKHLNPQYKYVFLSAANCPPNGVFYKLMEALGISQDRILIADRLYRFKKLHVPQQSFVHHGYFTDEFLTAYDYAADLALKTYKGKVHKKVYLTRSSLGDKTGFNENYFEDFYRRKGYAIVAPETLPLQDQIALFANAEEITCLLGTLVEMTGFAKNLKKVNVLMRVNEPGSASPIIRFLQARGAECSLIDVSCHPLPTTHANGRYYVGPTVFWKQYLDDNSISYKPTDLVMDWSYLHDYLEEYANAYSNPNSLSFLRMKNTDFFDLISRMNLVFNGTVINRTTMGIESKAELKSEIARLNALVNNKVAEPSAIPVYSTLKAVKPCADDARITKIFSRRSLIVDGVPYSREKALKELMPYYDSIKSSWVRIIGLFYARRLAANYDLMMHSENVPEPFTQEQLNRLQASEISAVFQTAFLAEGSLRKHYLNKYGSQVVDIVEKELKKCSDEYLPMMSSPNATVFDNTVIVFKKGCYDEFADWMLPIINEIGRTLPDNRVEVLCASVDILTTLYFNVGKDIVTARIK